MNSDAIGNMAMAMDIDRACDDDVDELEEEHRPRCDGCGGVLEPWDAEPPVIYYCFHTLHAGCADGRDACPRCHTPRRVHDDFLQPEPVDEVAPASPPEDDNPDEDPALASDGVGVGNGDRPAGGGETGEPRPSRCDGDGYGDGGSAASMSGSGCNHASASQVGCCVCSSRRVTELEGRLEETSAALTETSNVLESDSESDSLVRAQSRLFRLEEMYGKLEEEFIRQRNDKRAREVEDAEEEEAAEGRTERFKAPTRPH